MKPLLAPQRRTACSSRLCSTVSSSKAEPPMILRTSLVADWASRASCNSRAWELSCSCRSATSGSAADTRRVLDARPRRLLAGRPRVLPRALMSPPPRDDSQIYARSGDCANRCGDRCAQSAQKRKGPPQGGPSNIVARRLFRCRQRRRFRGLRFGCSLSRVPFALFQDERVTFDGDLAQAVHHRAGAGRDQTTDNDVLLEPVERIGLAVDGGFGEHARGLLERRRRDERARLQAGLGDAEQDRMSGCALLAFGLDTSIDFVEFDLVELLALQQLGLT